MNARNTIASCLVIALGIILAVHFALFWMYGGVFIYEDNRTILAVETVMSLAILLFGVERLLSAAGIIRNDGRKRPGRTGSTPLTVSGRDAASTGTISSIMTGQTSLEVHSSTASAGTCSSSCSPAGDPSIFGHFVAAGPGTTEDTGPNALAALD